MLSKQNRQAPDFISWRVLPGGLKVSRTLGSAEAKLKELGAIPEVVLSEPEVVVIPVEANQDFLLLGTSGLFDHLSPEQAVCNFWKTFRDWKTEDDSPSKKSLNEVLCNSVNSMVRAALINKSQDNISVLLIIFPSLLTTD